MVVTKAPLRANVDAGSNPAISTTSGADAHPGPHPSSLGGVPTTRPCYRAHVGPRRDTRRPLLVFLHIL